jgi:ell wall binding domain 2 (CWB2)
VETGERATSRARSDASRGCRAAPVAMVRPRMTAARPIAALACVFTVLGAAGCGSSGGGGGGDTGLPGTAEKPVLGQKGREPKAAEKLGFPTFATKNTTRVGGADGVADAAAVAQAVFPGANPETRPPAVALVDRGNWQAGVAASVLMAQPLRAPVLLTQDGAVPEATQSALAGLRPRGTAVAAKGAQVLRVGDAAAPSGYRALALKGSNPYALAREIDRFRSVVAGRPSRNVVVTTGELADFAMPAAAWAAKSGDSVLFVTRQGVPPDTRAAIQAHDRPNIYVLGPPSVVPKAVAKELQGLGKVIRIAATDPINNAIAFARYVDGGFGWGVVDPGHGLVFVNQRRPLDAAAAAPLSSSGTYGPLLLVDQPKVLPRPVEDFLLDIQPGYDRDPVRGAYNHGWIIGDLDALSQGVQARIDSLLEILPVNRDNGGGPGA